MSDLNVFESPEWEHRPRPRTPQDEQLIRDMYHALLGRPVSQDKLDEWMDAWLHDTLPDDAG